MSELRHLSPQPLWEIFDLICSIPHPSGHENALAEALSAYACQHGLACRMDGTGNLRIDRPAAPGFEAVPGIIFQAHLDMVPLAENENFDFVSTPITPYIDGGFIRARGTTLGADDGSGVALALAVLTDPELKCGPLAGLFTVSEETGLTGAAALNPAMLEGKYLINLDGGGCGKACIGCAGGARQEFKFVPEYSEPSEPGRVWQVTLSGLPGGHSGICIDLNRGNAIRSLAGFLLQFPELRLLSFDGGDADNAIPGEASARICNVPDAGVIMRSGRLFAALLGKEHPGSSPAISVAAVDDAGGKVFTRESTGALLEALALAPDGVISRDDTLNIVKTSSNLAAVFTEKDQVRIRTSQRSLDDSCREEASLLLAAHFGRYGADGKLENIYPGWIPQPDSTLVKCCAEVWQKLHGGEYLLNAVHAGLETGIIGRKNPDLEMISIGPETPGCHTPQEQLSIAEMAACFDYLTQLCQALAR